jgi:Phosphotransferase enzyme family
MTDASVPSWLVAWCGANLNAVPLQSLPLPKPASMAEVFGLVLTDGRSVAVKARPDESGRAVSCVEAQRVLAEDGFECARPLTSVTLEDEVAIHAEQWRPGGHMMRGDGPAVAERSARVLARLARRLDQVRVAPPVPNPRWVRWDHRDPGVWPAFAALDDLDSSGLPPHIEETARRATTRLLAADLPRVLGHADWETQNLRWHGTAIWTVHDWDSLAWLPEAAIVGAASGSFASAEIPTLAPLSSSAAFLEAYQHERNRRFTVNEIEVAWAASLWPATHNARGQELFERPPVAEAALREQARQRLELAHA